MTNLNIKQTEKINAIDNFLHINGLEVVGSFKPKENISELGNIETILLIGPNEPNFWNIFVKSEEYNDKKPDPLDRWSRRLLEEIGIKEKVIAYFPFDEKNIWPFYSWALECAEINASPVKLLVHNEKGLFLSFRGAIGLEFEIKNKTKSEGVCQNCQKPCLTACPVSALTDKGYNVESCKKYMHSKKGNECRDGCLVRKSCPFGSSFRLPEQSAFHMRNFLKS